MSREKGLALLNWPLEKWVKPTLFLGTILFIAVCIYAGLTQNSTVTKFVGGFLMIYLSLATSRTILLLLGNLLFRWKIHLAKQKDEKNYPFVTVIVPAFNEAKVIAHALESLLDLDYPHYEVLVIDDGSTDNTFAVAHSVAAKYPNRNCKIITKENGGKSTALNLGLTCSRGDLILCVDADSKLNKNAIRNGVKHFSDPKVGAVSGFVRLASLKNLWLLWQDLEYSIALNFTRPALALSGSVTIVPGPSGMFRRSALISVSGYQSDKEIFAEDADLTLRLLTAGWKVTSEEGMVSKTEGPENLSSILRQRYRWNRGILQAITSNFATLLMDRGLRGKLLLFYLVFDSYGVRIINFGLTLYFLGSFYFTGDLSLFTQWMGVLIMLDAITILFTSKGYREYVRNLFLLSFMKLSYSYILLMWGVFCLFEEWASIGMSWDKLERTAQIELVKGA